MKQTLSNTVIALLVIFLAACGQTSPEAELEPQFGTSAYDNAWDTAADTTGVYVVGGSSGALAGPNLGSQDAYIRKYSFSGSVLWEQQFGTRSFDGAFDIAIRGSRIYVLGATNGSLDGSLGFSDVFLRQYNSAGSVIWTRQFGTSGSDSSKDVAIDTSGNALVLSDDSNTDFTLRKISTTGVVSTLVSYTSAAGSSPFIPKAIITDSSNTIYLLVDRNDKSFGDLNAYIFKYSSSGTFLGYAYVAAGANLDYGIDLRLDGSHVFVLTREAGFSWIRKFPTTFSSSTLPVASVALDTSVTAYAMKAAGDSLYVSGYVLQSGDLSKGYVTRYTTALVKQWDKQFGSSPYTISNGIAVSAANNAVFPVGERSNFSGSANAFMIRFNMTTGTVVWQR
jgi:hypothetical protein